MDVEEKIYTIRKVAQGEVMWTRANIAKRAMPTDPQLGIGQFEPHIDYLNDTLMTVATLPDKLQKEIGLVCFHPRQFHLVPDANYRTLVSTSSEDYQTVVASLQSGWTDNFLGVFCPARAENGQYLVNRWGEIKFCAPDGMHRCFAQVEKWMKSPNCDPLQICCYGKWMPQLNHNKMEDRKRMWQIGTQNNETSAINIKETMGMQMLSLIKSRQLLEQQLAEVEKTKSKSKKKKEISDNEVAEFTGRKYTTFSWMFRVINNFPKEAINIIIEDGQKKGSGSRFSRGLFEVSSEWKKKILTISRDQKIRFIKLLRDSNHKVKGKVVDAFYETFFKVREAEMAVERELNNVFTTEQKNRYDEVMKIVMELVGEKAPGGFKQPLLPSMTKYNFINYILRGNSDNFGPQKETEEEKGESDGDSADNEGENGSDHETGDEENIGGEKVKEKEKKKKRAEDETGNDVEMEGGEGIKEEDEMMTLENLPFEESAIPDGSVDLLITDIPYNIYPDKEYDKFTKEDIKNLVSMIKMKMKENCAGFIFASMQQLPKLEKYLRNEGFSVPKHYFTVVYSNAKPPTNFVQLWGGGTDHAVGFYRGRITHLTNLESEIRVPNVRNNITAMKPEFREIIKSAQTRRAVRGSEQKSIELMRRIMEIFRPSASEENPNYLVWDPCCGTGTTGVICADFNLRFYGCEKDSTIYDKTFDRVYEAYQKKGYEPHQISHRASFTLEYEDQEDDYEPIVIATTPPTRSTPSSSSSSKPKSSSSSSSPIKSSTPKTISTPKSPSTPKTPSTPKSSSNLWKTPLLSNTLPKKSSTPKTQQSSSSSSKSTQPKSKSQVSSSSSSSSSSSQPPPPKPPPKPSEPSQLVVVPTEDFLQMGIELQRKKRKRN